MRNPAGPPTMRPMNAAMNDAGGFLAYRDLVVREAEIIGSADHLAVEIPQLLDLAVARIRRLPCFGSSRLSTSRSGQRDNLRCNKVRKVPVRHLDEFGVRT